VVLYEIYSKKSKVTITYVHAGTVYRLSDNLNTNVDFSDFIFVKIYSKFDVRKQKLSLNHKKIKAI
jgi:hypothetical protein